MYKQTIYNKNFYIQVATKFMIQNIHVCLVALWPSVVHFQLELVERAVQRVFSIKELGKVVFSRNTFSALKTKLVDNDVRLAPVNSSVNIRRAP